ncbi:hypothetical protein [Actinomadura logoneensis]|uniref:hypothetical protein n=1 Tax=Actinomadura logoneensis TaxID=2293572 RepID=UPI0011C10D1A|nr:hypothetical protein [Actinomadura logoneensis]
MLILGAVLVGAITMVAIGVARDRAAAADDERVRRLRDWAAEHHWTFHEGDLRVPWRGRVGRDGFRVRELLTGHIDGLPVSLGHGTYPTSRVVPDPDGGHRTETVTHHLTVLVVETAPMARPAMEVRPRGVGSRLLRVFGAAGDGSGGGPGASAPDGVDGEAVLPEGPRDRLSSDLIRAYLDDEPPLRDGRDGELMVVRHTSLHPADLDEHLGTLRRLTERLGHRS